MILFPTSPSLDSLLSVPDLDGAIVCATIADETGRVLYDHNGSLRVEPASNEKLFSAAFALWELGASYRPVTNFWKLTDRVIVESSGDPSLTHDQLTKVAADLGLNRSLPVFVKEPYGPGIPERWEVGDLPNRYAAPVAAFSVDQSGFELWNSDGRPSLRPEAYGVAVRFMGKKTGGATFSYDPLTRTVEVSGELPKKTVRLDTLAVPGAEDAAASLLGRTWKRVDKVPSDPPSATVSGRSLAEIVSTCLHRSDNNMAENLLLMGAAHEGQLPADCYPTALRRLEDFEHRIVGISPNDVLQRDGSGLTRENFVTTHAVVKLLAWAGGLATADMWKQAMASPGSGTLIRRLGSVSAPGKPPEPAVRFFGKTGSLANVTALSGYLETRHGRKLVLSVIINNFACSETQAVETIDRFVRFVSENAP